MGINIAPVLTNADKLQFYNFARQVYRNDPNWVPHLWPQRKEYLDKKAAFFSFGDGEFWLAREHGKPVGTIGTAIDHSFNREKGLKAAVFGFFEVLPERFDAACLLWDHARQWALSFGMTELWGPTSFTANDEHGFLVSGFETIPTVMMGHNPPYYAQYAEEYGFQCTQESLAYRFDLKQIGYDASKGPAAFYKIAERARRRHGDHVIRHPRMENWESEVDCLYPVYNKSLAVLPEFSPVELAEFRSLALGIKDVLDPELVFIAEVNGRVVGFSLGLPNINEALLHANGLRYPWDYLRFAWARRAVTGVSFKILAIDPDYWGYGLESAMIVQMGETVIRKGYQWVDGSLTNVLNPQTNKIAERVGASIYRRYKDYQISV